MTNHLTSLMWNRISAGLGNALPYRTVPAPTLPAPTGPGRLPERVHGGRP